jgi:hypothetical protein
MFVFFFYTKLGIVDVDFMASLCRPLPLDIGRFTCVIMKEILPGGLRWEGVPLYSLYINVSCSLTCE